MTLAAARVVTVAAMNVLATAAMHFPGDQPSPPPVVVVPPHEFITPQIVTAPRAIDALPRDSVVIHETVMAVPGDVGRGGPGRHNGEAGDGAV